MKIDIVVIHFGSLRVTKKCISSLNRRKSSFRKIILINNDVSSDISSHFKAKNIVVMNMRKNGGFARSINLGIRKAIKDRADAVMLLNNDAELEKGSIKELSNRISERVGIVGPIISFEKEGEKHYDHGGYIVGHTGKTTHDNRAGISKERKIHPDFISGCCMMVSKKVFEKIGYFDEDFFMYFEDVDFCLRARDAGFEIEVANEVVVHHDLSEKKSPQAQKYLLESNRVFHNKYVYKYPLGFLQPIRDTVVFSLKDPVNSGTYIRSLLK